MSSGGAGAGCLPAIKGGRGAEHAVSASSATATHGIAFPKRCLIISCLKRRAGGPAHPPNGIAISTITAQTAASAAPVFQGLEPL